MRLAVWKAAAAVLGLGLLGSCGASSRMMRISPLAESAQAKSDPERVNAWPLYYRALGASSALWPIWDHGQSGWALRPLYEADGPQHSVIWPLAHWNSELQDGRVLNTWWDFQYASDFTCLPLYRHSEEGFNHILPLWWMGDGKGWGLMPLLGDFTGDWSSGHILNTHWWKEGFFFVPLLYKNDRTLWLAELYAHDREHQRALLGLWWHGHEHQHLLPLYWRTQNGAADVLHLPPLYYSASDDAGAYRLFLPFYYRRSFADIGNAITVTPLGGWSDHDEGLRLYNVLGPLYWDLQTPRDSTTAIAWPLYYRWQDALGESHSLWVTPLVNVRREAAVTSTAIFPLWHSQVGGKSDEYAFFLGLARAAASEQGSSWRLWPLCSYTSDAALKDALSALTLQLPAIENLPDRCSVNVLGPFLSSCEFSRTDASYRWRYLLGGLQQTRDLRAGAICGPGGLSYQPSKLPDLEEEHVQHHWVYEYERRQLRQLRPDCSISPAQWHDLQELDSALRKERPGGVRNMRARNRGVATLHQLGLAAQLSADAARETLLPILTQVQSASTQRWLRRDLRLLNLPVLDFIKLYERHTLSRAAPSESVPGEPGEILESSEWELLPWGLMAEGRHSPAEQSWSLLKCLWRQRSDGQGSSTGLLGHESLSYLFSWGRGPKGACGHVFFIPWGRHPGPATPTPEQP